jgi:hypothetical protein
MHRSMLAMRQRTRPPDEFPYLNESATALVTADYDPAEEFTFGLDLVLAALEPRRTPA